MSYVKERGRFNAVNVRELELASQAQPARLVADPERIRVDTSIVMRVEVADDGTQSLVSDVMATDSSNATNVTEIVFNGSGMIEKMINSQLKHRMKNVIRSSLR